MQLILNLIWFTVLVTFVDVTISFVVHQSEVSSQYQLCND